MFPNVILVCVVLFFGGVVTKMLNDPRIAIGIGFAVAILLPTIAGQNLITYSDNHVLLSIFTIIVVGGFGLWCGHIAGRKYHEIMDE
jgi:hypothetical protein